MSRIPTINVSFPIASSADLVRLQNAYRLIDIVGGLLPYLVARACSRPGCSPRSTGRAPWSSPVSRSRARCCCWGSRCLIGRSLYANSLPPTVQRVDTAVSIYDQFVSLLRVGLRVGLVLGLLLAIIAFVAGGTTAARQLRASSSQAAAWLRDAGDRRGVSTGPVGVWLDQQRTLVRVVVVALAALALVLADRLTPAYVVTVFVVALVVLGLATLAARPRREEAEPDALAGLGVSGRSSRRRTRSRAPVVARSRPRFQSATPTVGGTAAEASRHARRSGSSTSAYAGTASADSPAR